MTGMNATQGAGGQQMALNVLMAMIKKPGNENNESIKKALVAVTQGSGQTA